MKYICIKDTFSSLYLGVVCIKGKIYEIDNINTVSHSTYSLIKVKQIENTLENLYINISDMRNFIKLEEYRNKKINEILEN